MESTLDIMLRIELYNFAPTNECITSKPKPRNSLVAINLEPPTPIRAVDEEAEVEDRTQQTSLLENPEDRMNLNMMSTKLKIPTFSPSTQLAERMMDLIAIPHTSSDVNHFDTVNSSKSRKVKARNNPPVLARVRKRQCKRRNGGLTACDNCLERFKECITSIPRRSNSRLVVLNSEPSTSIHAVDDVEDCTRQTRFPQNTEDLNITSTTFQIPTILSTARLPEQTIPDTSDVEDHSLANTDPVSYNYKGQEHSSYTEYLDTVRSESWKLKALNSRSRDAYVYDSNISEYLTCLYPSQQISDDRAFEIEPSANFSPIVGENGGVVDVVPTIISEDSSFLYTSQQIDNNRSPCANFSPFWGENGSLAHVEPTTISQYSSFLYSQQSSHDQLFHISDCH
ncbi:hypothetical protein C8J55DRAFT_553436 [Lentinula edodes]|uniref:Uncharacterized protein n=1 Tax=Lentinula lateritia TaxID=40482 RepID=A0A9W9E1W9_9AGAR|nr:hypothetical protein C8J55DRAFT_553436 [Lentinula edodes]